MPDFTGGIIDSLLHPPLGSLTPHLDTIGPRTGNVTMEEFGSPISPFPLVPVRNTFGMIVQVVSVPATWGRDLGYTDPLGNPSDVWHNRFAQIVIQHQLLVPGSPFPTPGAWVTTQIIELHSFLRLVLWETALPGRLGIKTAPGISLDLYYLTILG